MHSDFFANFSMRARLFALLILVLIIGIPTGIYWYFFTKNTASLTLSVVPKSSFIIQLDGIIDNKNLPLIDGLIHIDRQCTDTCTISPIAPLPYRLTIKSPWKSPIQADIDVWVNENKILTYTLLDEVVFESSVYQSGWSYDTARNVMDNVLKMNSDIWYTLVWIDNQERVYVLRDTFWRRELGILGMDRFTSLYVIPPWVGDFTLDLLWQYLLAPIWDTGTLILSLDGQQRKELPFPWIQWYIPSIFGDKIYTKSGVLAVNGDRYTTNPRFTDWIDVTSTLRIGYISNTDTEKLLLSNMPLGNPVLVLVDRSTGKSSVIKSWINVKTLFYVEGVPVLMDDSGNVWKILL